MYSNLLVREQLKTIHKLWNQHQIKCMSVCHSKHLQSYFPPESNNVMTTAKGTKLNIPLLERVQINRYYSVDSGQNKSSDIENRTTAERKYSPFTDIESLAPNYDIKCQLYNEEDDILRVLNHCGTCDELVQTLDNLGSAVRKEHMIQAIIVAWSICKREDSVQNKYATDILLLQRAIPFLSGCVGSLDLNEKTSCYLYLRKMGIENSVPLVEELLDRSLKEVNTSETTVGLAALSRLIVGISSGGDYFTPMLCADFIRHLDHHVSMLSTENDARLIAICMMCVPALIDDKMMKTYKAKVKHLLQTKELGAGTPKSVVKILNMLHKPIWSHKHTSLIRDLLLSLEPTIKQMETNDLKTVSRIYLAQIEPASLHATLSEAVEGLLGANMSPETLAYFVPYSQPHKRESLVNAYKALLMTKGSWEQPNAAVHLFSTLRGLKISDTKVCDAYWNGVLQQLNSKKENESNTRFLKHCNHYMNFNNNLGGTYRHRPIEKKLSQHCMRAIECDIYGQIPHKFAFLASFVLAYGHTPLCWKKYPNILLSKIINMSEQFSPADCSILSRGLQISMELRFRNRVPQLVGMQLAAIDNVLTSCMERYLNNNIFTAADVNLLVRALSNRKPLKNSVVYHKILQKYKGIKYEELNSRIIKDMSYNFLSTNYLMPNVLEKMLKYLENNYQHVGGETVEKMLTCIYNLGYTPKSYDSLHYAGQILLRDFDYMSGLSLVQSCLALCYYKTIPEELINKVFCVKFIQRVEDEIHMCYSKVTYPERVLNVVMQLNRSVCLDFPEAQVPWFQQNFIEAQMSKRNYVEDSFGHEVKSELTNLIKDDSYIRFNHTTPYGYHIDLVINFDKDKKLIQAPAETTMLDRITRVAILLLKLDSFCANDLKTLRGPDSLKIKHLEMMGYKVLHINEHDWNSKYMNAPGAKKNTSNVFCKYLADRNELKK